MANPFPRSSPPIAPLLITEPEAARVLGIGARTLWELRARGRIPFVRIGTAIRYDVLDLRAFIESAKSGTNAGSGSEVTP
jgi:excisionase family DNA binding protein